MDTMVMQNRGSLNQKSRLPAIMICSFVAFLLIGGALGFIWTVNLKFNPIHSAYIDFRETEILMIQLLDEYDVFRSEAPADPETWEEAQHLRNGQLNLAIKQLQHRYMLKIREYNFTAKDVDDFFFAVGCKINRIEIPKKIILSTS